MQLLKAFEELGEEAEKAREPLQWIVPITNWPAVQYYTEGKVKKVWVQWGPPEGQRLNTRYFVNTLQLAICFTEDVQLAHGRQRQGAAPNIIHSLDAAHLMLTVDACPFPVTTIHDSYGALLADVPELFVTVREQFVRIHKEIDIEEITGKEFALGSLDIELVKESEYCFS